MHSADVISNISKHQRGIGVSEWNPGERWVPGAGSQSQPKKQESLKRDNNEPQFTLSNLKARL